MRNVVFVLMLGAFSAVSAAARADAPEREKPQGKMACVPIESAAKYLSENGYKPAWIGKADQKNKTIQNTFMIMAKDDGEWIALNAPMIPGDDGKPRSDIVCISGHGTQGVGRNVAEAPPPSTGDERGKSFSENGE